jgi:trehalose/maltose hydrolase-like predicted phosphorylase
MSAYPKIVVTPPGPKARELVKKDESLISPSYVRFYPLVVEYGKSLTSLKNSQKLHLEAVGRKFSLETVEPKQLKRRLSLRSGTLANNFLSVS